MSFVKPLLRNSYNSVNFKTIDLILVLSFLIYLLVNNDLFSNNKDIS